MRVTEAQAAMFGVPSVGVTEAKNTKALRSAKQKQAMGENVVEGQILGFLRARGWLVERQPAGAVVGLGPLMAALERGQPITRELVYRSIIRLGEKGRADWVAVRPRDGGGYDRVEVEIKAAGRKPSAEQAKYLRDRAACGFLCGWWDSLESFYAWYAGQFGER